jgi:hypothetical protein
VLKTPFAENAERTAKREAKQRATTIDFWYRRKYGLTINDPRFLNTTEQERMTDYWAHRYVEDPKLMNEVEDEDFDEDDIMAEWAARAETEAQETASHEQLADPDDWEDL